MKRYLSILATFIVLIFLSGSSPFSLSAQAWDTLANIPASLTFPVVAVVEGKIHVMGGGGETGATSKHYAYDPATDSWESRAAVPYLAQQPAGTAANGKIHYFGGGYPNSGSPLDDHFIYDGGTDTWEQAADLTAPRAIHYAVALDDVVYSLAGQGMTNLCQTYNTMADEWVTMNNLPDGSFFYGAHVVTGGHIYRFCGGGYLAPNNHAHIYDPGSDSWSSLPDFPTVSHGIHGAAIGDKIFLAGGYYDFMERDEVWIFDTQTLEYSSSVPLPFARNYHKMVSIDSCIYVVGGHHQFNETVNTQLLRLCPYGVISSTTDVSAFQKLPVHYFSGNLSIQLPEGLMGTAQLSMADLLGRQVFHKELSLTSSGKYVVPLGDLSPSVYFVIVRIGKQVYTSKIVAP